MQKLLHPFIPLPSYFFLFTRAVFGDPEFRPSSDAPVSFQYTILPDQQLILVRFEGAVSQEGFVSSARAICADERYVRGMDGFIDVTRISVAVSPGEIEALVDFTLSKRKHGHGRWAVLTDTPTATAFAMLYQQGVSDKHPFSIFCSFEGVSDFLCTQIDADFLEKFLPHTAGTAG
jgi:hypothetical protein